MKKLRQRRTEAAAKVLVAIGAHPWLCKESARWARLALKEWLTIADVERMEPEEIAFHVMDRVATAGALAGYGILPIVWN